MTGFSAVSAAIMMFFAGLGTGLILGRKDNDRGLF